LARSTVSSSSKRIFGESKYLGSGQARTEVPEALGGAEPVFLSFEATSPCSKAIS